MSLSGSKFYASLLVFSILVFQVCQAKDYSSSSSSSRSQNNPTSDTSSPSVVKLSSVSGVIVGTPKDGLTKRDAKVSDLSGASSGAITAKSYDPPPEFYRGPGSTSASVSPASGSSASTANSYNNHNNHQDSATAGFISKPIAFPGIGDSSGRNKYGATDSNGQYVANSFNNWQQLKGSAPGLGGAAYNSNNIHDRISVGHYGSAGHSSNPGTSGYTSGSSISDGGSNSGGGASTYAYEGGHHPAYYGGHSAGHYATSGHGGGGSYYGGSSAEGIPFDVYGTKHGGASGGGHYAGAGGEYSYTYPDLHAEPPTHKGHELGLGGGAGGGGGGHGHGHELSSKALLAKSFLIPLASAAVLGIAAALVSNPLLLQLGTVSGIAAPALIGKRKRRDLAAGSGAAALGLTKELPLADSLAYRGQRQRQLTRV